ncbi:MAG: TIGR04086 family membrane protein [Ruminococcus sp.]
MQVKSNINIINKHFIRSMVFGVVISSVTIALLLFICTFLFVISGKYPESIIEYIALVFLAVGGFVGGNAGGRIYKSNGIFVGGIIGIIMFLIIILSGLISNFASLSIFTLYKFIILIVTSALGGIVGVNKKDKIHIK